MSMIPIITQERLEFFWNHVKVSDDTSCWEWQGARQTDGYGTFWINKKSYLAHRMAYLIHYNDLPDDLCILHECDNPPCCNPNHLRIGTHADNMRDRASRHRIDVRGSSNGRSKLDDDDVMEIRRRYNMGGVYQKELAKEYGITQTLVSMIVLGKSWKHLPLR